MADDQARLLTEREEVRDCIADLRREEWEISAALEALKGHPEAAAYYRALVAGLSSGERIKLYLAIPPEHMTVSTLHSAGGQPEPKTIIVQCPKCKTLDEVAEGVTVHCGCHPTAVMREVRRG